MFFKNKYPRCHSVAWWLIKLLGATCLALSMSGCEEDLVPDDSALEQDGRASVNTYVDTFSVNLTTGENLELTTRLETRDAVVFYFTMWCPICDSHMNHIRKSLLDAYPNVAFVMVDYVSGNTADSRASQSAGGYGSLDVVADTDDFLQILLQGTMGSIAVIDKNQVIQLNEYFRSDENLTRVLNQL